MDSAAPQSTKATSSSATQSSSSAAPPTSGTGSDNSKVHGDASKVLSTPSVQTDASAEAVIGETQTGANS
ncbi:MAG: hypothetical protein CYPHOPRED_004294 [Cyphobasidiales sp. Tagirdzhanova-0007]|nr:MAG: hypothetical protein CYPHOPRED_004294 [Cyphobasidiales sp. Tagirdzhanova-0007]